MNELDFDELDDAVNSLVAKDQSNDGENASQAVKKEHPPRLTAKPPVPPAMARGSNRGFIDIMAPKPPLKAPPRTAPTVIPLTNHTPAAEPIQNKVSVEEPAPVEEVTSPPVETAKPPAPEPTPPVNSTPFVNADKVEKRPLGAYSEYTPEVSKTEPQSVPPELSPDILAVEAGEFLPERPEPKPEPKSMPAQYKKVDKAVDNTPRPVYDAQDYHPPLLEPKVERKKMATWLKVLIVIIILVLLGTGGYLAYQFMTQTP